MPKSSFGFKQPQDSPGFMLWQTSIVWQRLIKEALSPHKVSHAQFVMMACLLWFSEQKIKPSQTEIVQLTKLDKMTVSQVLKKSIADELISRQENPRDTRAKLIALTPTGKRLTQKLVPIIEQIDRQYFGPLKKDEQQEFIRLLNHISSKS